MEKKHALKEEQLNSHLFSNETRVYKHGFSLIVGIDEAGRGPLAGPVVAAAVLLKTKEFSSRIRDSKKLTPKQREEAFREIYENAYVGVGIINETAIDLINILQASFVAMDNAVSHLIQRYEYDVKTAVNKKQVCLLIDGNRFKTDHPYYYECIVKGDQHSISIACASIVAKVIRDRIISTYDKIFPQYGFKKNKGYPTQEHKKLLHVHGPSLIHRKTFSY